MNIRRSCVALLLAGGVVLGVGAVPAFADLPVPPPVPAGCTWDPGVLSCVSTTPLSTATLGPFSTDGVSVPASTTFGGFTGAQICLLTSKIKTGRTYFAVLMSGVLLTESVFSTTTTERYGLNGEIFDTSSTISPPRLTSVAVPPGAELVCNYTGGP